MTNSKGSISRRQLSANLPLYRGGKFDQKSLHKTNADNDNSITLSKEDIIYMGIVVLKDRQLFQE